MSGRRFIVETKFLLKLDHTQSHGVRGKVSEMVKYLDVVGLGMDASPQDIIIVRHGNAFQMRVETFQITMPNFT